MSEQIPNQKELHLFEVEVALKHLSEDQLRVLIGRLPENPGDTHFRDLIPKFDDVSDEDVIELAIRILGSRPF